MGRPGIRRTLISLGLLALGALWMAATAIWFKPLAPAAAAPQVGFRAPDFTLTTSTGEQIRLSDLRGQVVLINVWASWCPPCKAEMPDLESVYGERRDEGFVVLAVNATAGDTVEAAEAFFAEKDLTFPLLLDPESVVSEAYQVRLLPTSILIDQEGIVQGRYTGAISAALLNSELDTLLGGGE